ncbi:MAG TPA: bifunctional glutamate N-acetyltransferase/amino-acid acetyltransferase ArgJ, partial [Gammaproteobacteria bacterium]|nr:bifunctional glutamate N-acetyltransferase/amino-acid acetyltransferase ArgJ [Gammaproteobacteria bacterium]
RARGIIVNSGNANACTGGPGYSAASDTAASAEKTLGLSDGDLLVSSTGVIGVPLPVEKITSSTDKLAESLRPDGFMDAAGAIMTTDAYPKAASVRLRLAGGTVTITGIAKGAGMICPDMATMLAFFATDASIEVDALKKAVAEANERSFNSIMVDNDTSTNDMMLVLANGESGTGTVKAGSRDLVRFTEALTDISIRLAHMIVRDGEGATRFIEICVRGAASVTEARNAARTIGSSMLVKTAFFGGDPNWGRLIAAAGRAGVRMNPDRVDMTLNGVPVVKDGLDTGKEAEAARAIDTPDVTAVVDLKAGKASATVWTTDLSYEYVKINSEYRT